MSEALSNQLSERRKAAGLTQQELAEAVGVHWITISKLERGKTRLTLDWMARLAKPLNVSPRDLMPEDFGSDDASAAGEASTIGERILLWRKARGISQTELAEMCEATQSSVQRWESGGVPSADVIPALARALRVDILTLFGMGDDAADNPIRPRLGAAHTEAARLLSKTDGMPTDKIAIREAARDKIIALAERLKIEAAQGLA